MDTLTIRRPDDFHVHFRQDGLLDVVGHTAKHFGRALVMPNTDPPILDAQDALRYCAEIAERMAQLGCTNFQPLMTIKLTNRTTPEMIVAAKEAGVIAGKIYPAGVTTGSDDGITEICTRQLFEVYAAMEEVGMILSIHGETPGACVLGAEEHFADDATKWILLIDRFPNLKVVLEHVSTEEGLSRVYDMPPNFVGTITAHHLLLTIDDVIGAKMRPHNFCKPIARYAADRKMLIRAATSGNPKFFFGSDSAPHLKVLKESRHAPPGCFTAPAVLPLLAQVFKRHFALDKLQDFVSRFGAQFYDLPPNEEMITLVNEPWDIPLKLNGCVPFMAGETLDWRVED